MTTKTIIISFFLVLLFGVSHAQQTLLFQQALDFSYREQWDSAIACYNRMPERNTNYYFDRGMCYLLNTQFQEAQCDFFVYTELHPNEADGWLMLAESALYNEDFQLAQRASGIFSKLESNNSAAKFIKACAFFYQKKFFKSKYLFKVANRLDPNAILPKIYLSNEFNQTFSRMQWPSCFGKMTPGGIIIVPSSAYEDEVFKWHCKHSINSKFRYIRLIPN